MRSLVNFQPSTQNSEYFFLMSSFCSKYARFELQNTEGLPSIPLNSDAEFE